MKRLIWVFVVLLLVVAGFAMVVYQRPKVSRESVGDFEVSVKGYGNNNVDLLDASLVSGFVSKVSTDSAKNNYFDGLKSVEWELVGDVQSGYKVYGANEEVVKSVGYDYNKKTKQLILKVHYAPAVLNELYGLGERGVTRFNIDLIKYLCMSSGGDVSQVEYCGKIAREYIENGTDKKQIFVIRKKVGIKMFSFVKSAFAQCSGSFQCGTPSTSGCTCSQSGYTCDQNEESCGTYGICSGCTTTCNGINDYKECSTWNYSASTCTAVKTNCVSPGTCIVGGSYNCNWACTVNCSGRCGVWSCGQYCGDCPPGVTPIPTTEPERTCGSCTSTGVGNQVMNCAWASQADCDRYNAYGTCTYNGGCCCCVQSCCNPPCSSPPPPSVFGIIVYDNGVRQNNAGLLINNAGDGVNWDWAASSGDHDKGEGNEWFYWEEKCGNASCAICSAWDRAAPKGSILRVAFDPATDGIVEMWKHDGTEITGSYGSRNEFLKIPFTWGTYEIYKSNCGRPSTVSGMTPSGIVPYSSRNNFSWNSSGAIYRYQFGIGVGVTSFTVLNATTTSLNPEAAGYGINPGINYLWSVSSLRNSSICPPSSPATANVCFENRTCDRACGQTLACGGDCGNSECGDFGPATNLSPLGSLASPVVVSTPSVVLRWTAPILAGKDVEDYYLRVHDMTANPTWTRGCTGIFCDESVTATATNMTYTFPTSGSLIPGHIYHWWVYPHDHDSCINVTGTTCTGDDGIGDKSDGYFRYNPAPTYSSFRLQNRSAVNVAPDASNRNHICQTEFDQIGSRRARFVVTVSDADGATDIASVGFRLISATDTYNFNVSGLLTGSGTFATPAGGASYFVAPTAMESGNNMTLTFPVEFDLSQNSLYDMQVTATDAMGSVLPWTSVGRTFKIWNCEVITSGGIYDASAIAGASCTNSYTNLYSGGMFTSLLFRQTSVPVPVDATSNLSGGNQYNAVLKWGSSYWPDFNDDIGVPNLILRSTVSGRLNGGVCAGDFTIDDILVDPYGNSHVLDIDYAGVRDQENWYQVMGGGAFAGTLNLTNAVPVTCRVADGCYPAISVNGTTTFDVGDNSSGLVSSGGSIINSGGCDGTVCFNGYPNPDRNWSREGSDYVLPVNYSSLLEDIYHSKSVGVTTVVDASFNWSNYLAGVGGGGVIFVDARSTPLTINGDSTVVGGGYLVLIVNGNVIIDQGVNRFDGILIASGTITAGGSTANGLVINGSVYANRVDFSRNYNDLTSNNTNPAVRVVYRPEFIFNIPQKILLGLAGWTVGGGL